MTKLFEATTYKLLKNSTVAIFAVAASQAVFPIDSAKAFIDRWEVTGTGDKVVAADCSNCEEDTGIIMECTGAGQPVKTTLNAAAARKGKDGAIAPVSIKIDGQIFTIQAKTVKFGLIGFTPVFNLAPNHPLVSAMQSGSKATINFNGEESSLGLKGSSAALKKFKAHCQWTGVTNTQTQPTVFGVQPGETHTTPNAEGLLWYTSSISKDKIIVSRQLRYAIPETDAIAMVATCDLPNTNVYKVQFSINFGPAKKGDLVSVIFNFDQSKEIVRKGFVFIGSSESAGVNLSLAAGDEFWTHLASAKSFTVGVKGQPNITLPAAAKAASYFVSKCK